MQAELQKPQAMSEAEAVAVWDVWQLDLASRWQLYRHWLHKYQGKLQRRIQHHAALYQSAAERLAELRMQEDLSILKQAQVVGMTTTGKQAGGCSRMSPSGCPGCLWAKPAAVSIFAQELPGTAKCCRRWRPVWL